MLVVFSGGGDGAVVAVAYVVVVIEVVGGGVATVAAVVVFVSVVDIVACFLGLSLLILSCCIHISRVNQPDTPLTRYVDKLAERAIGAAAADSAIPASQGAGASRIHAAWHQTSCRTGRLSCSRPSLQQVTQATASR